MRTVEIPGGTVTFRESDDLRAMDSDLIEAAAVHAEPALRKIPPEVQKGKRDNETVEEWHERASNLMSQSTFSLEESQALLSLRRATLLATLDSWTLRYPLPKTLTELGQLPRSVVVDLDKAIGGVAAVTLGIDTTLTAKQDSPTTGSRSLDGPSRDDQEPTPILNSSPDTANTSTDGSIRG